MECIFGILKKRFSILKKGIRLGSIEKSDKVWRTCCALHNLLLFNDGLDKNWDADAKEMNFRRVDDVIPFALRRLTSDDRSSCNHATYETGHFNECSKDGKRVLSKIPLNVFQERLIHHFDLRFKKNDIKWPCRKSKK